MWILSLTLGAALAADCPEPTSSITLGATLDRAEAAFSDLDTDRFADEMATARKQVPCLDETVAPSLAASLHRFEGLAAFLGGSTERARMAFAGARSLEPAYRFPRTVVPEGNPVLADYEAVDPTEGHRVEVPAPAEGAVRLDGRIVTERSTAHPVLFQRTDASGAVAASAYLWPSMSMPSYPVASTAAVAPTEGGGRDGKGFAAPGALGLFAGAGAAAITSGVLYGLARGRQSAFDDPTTPYADLPREQQAANQLGTASGVALGVAAGAAVGGVLVGVF